MMRYGFQRLVLLGSAAYQRAELPLDDSVSLIAPNNTGKTSLINALQFLLIIDKRRMDFGAHEFDKSRRFYFPNNSAYILLEATLPEAGTIVLGCVGKGVSHDYEYFAYRGALNIEDFRQADGSLVSQPQLGSQLAQTGKSVFSYTASDFADLLYGGRKKRALHEPDFTIFRLENVSDAAAFQRVLTRTLKLDKLKSADVKDYLLQIFRRDLPDASIDFKQEWDKAFAEVNAEREQYLAALKLKPRIHELEKLRDERLSLRGKIIALRPLIEQRLGEWQQHYEDSQQRLEQEQSQLEKHNEAMLLRDRELTLQQSELEKMILTLQQQDKQQRELTQRFSLIRERSQIQLQLDQARQALEAQITLVNMATSREPDAIRRDLERNAREIQRLQRQLGSINDNLWQRLSQHLAAEELDRLNRVFNREVMTLGSDQVQLDEAQLAAFLEQTDQAHFELPGLRLALDSLSAQHQEFNEQDLRVELDELKAQKQDLIRQGEAAQALDAAHAQKTKLQQELRNIEQELADFDELQQLKLGAAERSRQLAGHQVEAESISHLLAESSELAKQQRQQMADITQQLSDLEQQHQDIDRRRKQRVDQQEMFTYLNDLAHQPWLAGAEISLQELAARLADYQRDCARLTGLDRDLNSGLSELHSSGLTKYQYSEDIELELAHIIDFSHQLAKEAEALEKKARSAVVNVTASLRELRDGLRAFKSRMREFNRLISHRQLSDLKVFKIEPEDEPHLVDAIEQLISTAEQVESGDTFEIFNQASVLDDAGLERAKQILVDEGNARQGLRVSDLFRLSFIVSKLDGEPEAFDDLDSAASNGTVLMAKLVTGLAMLHLMQDKRYRVQTICYLDEALALDARNQKCLIDTAAEFGFALIFASPAPLTTARYCVPIVHQQGKNHISRQNWQILESLAERVP